MATMTTSSKNQTGISAGRTYNLSAGPGCLAEEVLRQVQQEVWDIDHTGIGILEHSHRGKVVDRIWNEVEQDFREIGGVPKNYRVLFLTGGATSQNYMIPMNLAPRGAGGAAPTADYFVTGYWAEKSAEEFKKFGNLHVAATSADKNHSYVPSPAQTKYSASPAYVHYCSNNTIYGTEFWKDPTPPAGVPLVCDASSDIYSKPIDFTKFGLVYAGAQKNLGAAGTTIVVIREDLLERCPKEVPTMLQYRVHAKDGSRHNTPPVSAVYIVGLVMKWIKAQGGLEVMAKHNQAKAKQIYDVLDSSSFYTGHAEKASRSLMNITFRCPSEALDEKFVKAAGAAGFDGCKGHRATGGMRASTYNAFPAAGAKAFAEFMREFERTNG
ncbi:MAG: 3-phosphoserine/phosphohydroxythreonine transaminase [Phycisphaeraceae bacterium]|nr:3-phosphoserine/phosphohydroxythreonine transaminase [Phycisphaeraceae bacterium]